MPEESAAATPQGLDDDKLGAMFGKDRCTMFEMQKLLSPHLTAA